MALENLRSRLSSDVVPVSFYPSHHGRRKCRISESWKCCGNGHWGDLNAGECKDNGGKVGVLESAAFAVAVDRELVRSIRSPIKAVGQSCAAKSIHNASIFGYSDVRFDIKIDHRVNGF